MDLIRILFVSDTHLGFDLPRKPRVKRRRRGPDFFENFERALEPARRSVAHSRRLTTPPFNTNLTFLSAEMSVVGSPSTATRSA